MVTLDDKNISKFPVWITGYFADHNMPSIFRF